MINLHKNGTVTIQDILLRVPTLGEYGQIVDLAAELSQQTQPILERQRELRTLLETEREDIDGIRKELRDLRAESASLFSQVITGIVLLLADDHDAAEKFAADPPAWTQDFAAYLQLQTHWSTAPFVGVDSPPG